jgi:hypothetical protein
MWIVRFEHCSDSSFDFTKKASGKAKALKLAADTAIQHLDRCDEKAAAEIERLHANGEYEQVVGLFVQEQESGGDCRLEINKV